jgi:hypothetical protein
MILCHSATNQDPSAPQNQPFHRPTNVKFKVQGQRPQSFKTTSSKLPIFTQPKNPFTISTASSTLNPPLSTSKHLMFNPFILSSSIITFRFRFVYRYFNSLNIPTSTNFPLTPISLPFLLSLLHILIPFFSSPQKRLIYTISTPLAFANST